MQSKHSTDLGKQRHLFVETKSLPLTLLAPFRLRWGAVLNFQQIPIPAHMLMDTTEWTRISEAVSALASVGVQQRWLKPLPRYYKLQRWGASTNPRGQLASPHEPAGTGQSELRSSFPTGTEPLKKTAVPSCTQNLHTGILWWEKNLKIFKRMATKSPIRTLSKLFPFKWRGK